MQLAFLLKLITVNGSIYSYIGEFNSSEIPEDANLVFVEGHPINTITPGMFAHLTQCKSLSFTRTNISKIEPDAWLGLDELNFLDLPENELELTFLKARMFNHLSSIIKISFYKNKITSIDV